MSSNCGYCFDCPVSDELSRRLAPVMKSMQAQGITYALDSRNSIKASPAAVLTKILTTVEKSINF